MKLSSSNSYRKECESALVFGTKIIREIACTLILKKYLYANSPLSSATLSIQTTPEIIKRITRQNAPQDGIGEFELPKYQDLSKCERVIILDRVQDPGNVGTIIRTAKGLGYDGVYLLGNCADPFSPKAVSASKGSVFTMPLGCGEFSPFLKTFNLYATDMNGDKIGTVSFKKPYALIFGNEGSGIDDKILKNSKVVAIELSNQVESLNVAAAAAIFCYSAVRSEE